MDGLSKEMRDPFVLNPEETVSEEQRKKSKDGFIIEEVDGIFEILEGAVDKYYNKLEAAKKKQPKAEW